MKIPQTFLPENGLEEKTKQLLKKRKRKHSIDKEAEGLFPNFIDYLKKEYQSLYMQKVPKKHVWLIYRQDTRNVNTPKIGMISDYTEKEGIDTMYGYKVEIEVNGKHLELIYREGYQRYNNQGRIMFHKDPARYDVEEIPFP